MRNFFLMLVLTVTTIAIMSCEKTKTQDKPQKITEPDNATNAVASDESVKDDEPPLLLEDEPPLLLDEEPLLLLDDEPAGDPSTAQGADNSRCFVCHLNYAKEDIAVTHARQNIGCATCHGECDEHMADESWAWGKNGTAPDIMYPREKIKPFCMGCHPKETINTEQHESLFDLTKNKTCTDCHGDHRLLNRKTKWK